MPKLKENDKDADMKWFFILLSFCCLSAFAGENTKEDDLSHFDTPFLIGDWYLMNPRPDESAENFRAIKLSLALITHSPLIFRKKIILSIIGKVCITPMKTQLCLD